MNVSVARQRLRNRRQHWLYRFESGGQMYTGGIGRFNDGRIAEIFINGSRPGAPPKPTRWMPRSLPRWRYSMAARSNHSIRNGFWASGNPAECGGNEGD